MTLFIESCLGVDLFYVRSCWILSVTGLIDVDYRILYWHRVIDPVKSVAKIIHNLVMELMLFKDLAVSMEATALPALSNCTSVFFCPNELAGLYGIAIAATDHA